MANEDYRYLMLVNAIPQHLELSAFATVQQVVLTVVSENLGRLMTVKGRRSGTTAKDCKLHILPALVDRGFPYSSSLKPRSRVSMNTISTASACVGA
jgi:hypothetical protein